MRTKWEAFAISLLWLSMDAFKMERYGKALERMGAVGNDGLTAKQVIPPVFAC
jgi:hypothetical protein